MDTAITNELKQLQEIIILQLREKESSSLSPAFRDNIATLVTQIKSKLMLHAFSDGDEHHARQYIRYHQQAIIQFLDYLNEGYVTNGLHKEIIDWAIPSLNELLSYIYSHFSKLADMDLQAPRQQVAALAIEMQPTIQQLQEITTGDAITAELVTILLSPLQRINPAGKPAITVRQLAYAHTVGSELSVLMQKGNRGEDHLLRETIILLNINSLQAFSCYTSFFRQLMNEAETESEKLERLSIQLKHVNQARMLSGISFSSTAPSIKLQLSSYIIEELDHWERMKHLRAPTVATPVAHVPSSFKIMMELSVSQLSYLLKIFTEMKIIRNTNLSELLRFVSGSTVSKRAEHISYDSLRAKFYNAETSSRLAIRELLASMVAYIDKNKYND